MSAAKTTILVIDDNPDILKALHILLEANNYEVVTAVSAEEGLKVFKAASPDFILVDLMMEDVDAGQHFAQELKILGNKAPVYLLSSAGDSMLQNINYADLGFDGVLQKPYDNAELLKVIATKLKNTAS